MKPQEPAQGLVLYCDRQGQVAQVVRDDLGTHISGAVGRPFPMVVDRSSFYAALSFLAALRARSATSGWILEAPTSEGPAVLRFAGAISGDRMVIIAAPSPAALQLLSDETLHGGGESAGVAGQSIAECGDASSTRSPGPANSDEAVLNEFTRLTNELARLQRETAKQNAELQARNRLVRDRADQLELRVEQSALELTASRSRYSTMLETTGMGIAITDSEGRIAQANPALQQIVQVSDEALHGLALTELFFDPDGGAALETSYPEMMVGHRDNFRLEGYCSRRDGELAWVNMTIAALKGPSGTPDGAVVMVEDITEKRQAQAALLHAERLTLAGKLAATLAHEINNPLQSIIGCVGLAEEAVAAGASPDEYLALARSELRRVAGMVGRMRDLHRAPGAEQMHWADINNLLEQVLALSRKECADRNVSVSRQLDPAAPAILAVVDQLRQVFLNMVLNAVEAMPGGGNLLVRSERTSEPQGVRVVFADDGVGIAPDVLPHIFKAFYSTKPAGTGIGLVITQDIVRRLGGQIEVDTEPGKGTAFSIWLPAIAPDA